MNDPEWLLKMRAAGQVISETYAAPPEPPPTIPLPPRLVPAREARTPAPAPAAVRTVIEVEIPVRLVSEANTGGKRRAAISRKTAVKEAVRAALPAIAGGFPLPCRVTFTRLGGKPLDEDDNLPRACKAVKDVVAEWLGVSDTGRDSRVRWRYRQAPAYAAGVRIRVEHTGG